MPKSGDSLNIRWRPCDNGDMYLDISFKVKDNGTWEFFGLYDANSGVRAIHEASQFTLKRDEIAKFRVQIRNLLIQMDNQALEQGR